VVRDLDEVESARVAAIGCCFGGQCALELARSGAEVLSVVSFLDSSGRRARPNAVA
jgi:dienelactone hydrolase